MLNNKDIANAIDIVDSLISTGIFLPAPGNESIPDLAKGAIIGIIASKLEESRNSDSGAIKDLPGDTFLSANQEAEKVSKTGLVFSDKDEVETLLTSISQLENEKENLAQTNATLTRIIKELSNNSNCPVEYFVDEGVTYAVFGTSAITYVKELREKLKK